MPTSVVVDCMDVLLPVITKIVNLSLTSGIFPTDWKESLVTPLLKKEGLNVSLLENYRPVSNLSFISKLVEKAIFNQVHHYMTLNNLYPPLQSAYRKNHSTETTLIKLNNDVLLKMNSQHVILLILLDLSSAFDTVDHSILLNRMFVKFGISGLALDWFASYLSGRSQRIFIQGETSDKFDLMCGVPQGSCLGPLLFIMYSSGLFDVIQHHLPDTLCYADDTQLYLSFKPDSVINQINAISAMENCISDVRTWMFHNRLMLNDSKTEFICLGTKHQLSKINIPFIVVGESNTVPVYHVRNLGSWFDSNMSMSTHITKVSSAAFYHLHNIKRISRYLSARALTILIHAFVTSRIDYSNGLLYELPNCQLSKLQRIQNAAARLVTNSHRRCHITPILNSLHWLPVKFRIEFKILLLVFKCLHGLSPYYLSELVNVRTQCHYNFKSTGGVLLKYPPGRMLATLGSRAFSSVAPVLWNNLPADIRNVNTQSLFKTKLKTFLFCRAFSEA